MKYNKIKNGRKVKHGMKGSKEYSSWQNMKERCYRETNIGYKSYGGRGITVCDDWINSFENFFKDVGLAPSSKHSLDRINVNLGYSKDNCKWSTQKEQMSNTTKNVFIEFDGEIKTLAEWSRVVGLHPQTIRDRMNRFGWPAEYALFREP